MTAPDLRQRIGEIARALLSEPNKLLSTRRQLRFGTNGSLAVEIDGPKRGQWYDHEEEHGGGPLALLTVKGRMTNGAAVEWLQSVLGIRVARTAASRVREPIAIYDYRDEHSSLLFQVCRFGPKKTFAQRAPDGNGGWRVNTEGKWTIAGVRRVVYRLPELLAAPADQLVFVVEGEKDVDRLASLGLVATCNPGGAGKWRARYAVFFQQRDVVILPDNDDAGRDHARSVAANLEPFTASVRLLELPNLPPKGDISDWFAAGGNLEELLKLAAEAPAFLAMVEDGATPPEFSDDALARQFTETHATDLRYVASLGRWRIWTRSHWRADDTMQAFDLARAVCRSASALIPADQKRFKFVVASAKTVAAVERLARADRRHATAADQWDFDPWIFNPAKKETL
jgi:putative DNA primase/helicase